MNIIPDFMASLGKRIRTAREISGKTQEQVAEQIGVSRTAVSRWELGEIEPNIQNLLSLAKALNVSTDFLLGVEPDNSKFVFLITERGQTALKILLEEIVKTIITKSDI